jgi:hypothetical protein
LTAAILLFEVLMRSGLVFNASERIPNRFLLCRVLAAAARKMHRDGVSTSQCINTSLSTLSQQSDQPELPPQIAPELSSEVAVAAP